jgi:hypothetical protein
MSEVLDSVHERCLESLAAWTRELALPGLAQVYVRSQHSDEAIEKPCVVWTPEGEMEEDPDSQGWEYYDVIYPGRCYLVADAELGNERMRQVLLGWRYRILDNLRRLGSLPGVPECYLVQPKYGVAIDPKLPQYATVQGAFTAQCFCRKIKLAEVDTRQTSSLK